MSFKNRWTICSGYDFQAHQQHSQQRICFSQTALSWFDMLPGLSSAFQVFWRALPGVSPVLPGVSPVLPGAPRLVAGAPRCYQACHRRTQACCRRSQALPVASGGHCVGPVNFEIWPPRDSRRATLRHPQRLPMTKIHFADVNVGLKHPIGCNNSTHTPSWWFYVHCGIQETGIPGIIYIASHPVLIYPSEYRTSSFRKHLLAKKHIAKSNEITKSEVTDLTTSTVDETSLAVLKSQWSRGFTLVSS